MVTYLFIAANESQGWGGSEPLWSSAAEQLARIGHEVRVSVPEHRKSIPQVNSLRLAGCKMFYRTGYPPFFHRITKKLFSVPEYTRTHLKAISRGVNLIVISQGGNIDGLPWMEHAHSSGCKYVVIAQGANPYFWPDDSAAQRLNEAYSLARSAYFVSKSLIDLSRNQFASSLANAKIVRNPFNVPYDSHLVWPDTTPFELKLACVGRLDGATKGHDLLLQVLGLPHWRERSVRVSVIGEGPNARVLTSMAGQLKLKSVHFLGHQRNIEDVWRTHHALILASRFEGMPLVVVEAMLCGRPCIATDVGGCREIIRDGINGFLAKAATMEMVDEAMNRAWQHRQRLEQLGLQAAVDAHAFVSADPVQEFVKELESLATP